MDVFQFPENTWAKDLALDGIIVTPDNLVEQATKRHEKVRYFPTGKDALMDRWNHPTSLNWQEYSEMIVEAVRGKFKPNRARWPRMQMKVLLYQMIVSSIEEELREHYPENDHFLLRGGACSMGENVPLPNGIGVYGQFITGVKYIKGIDEVVKTNSELHKSQHDQKYDCLWVHGIESDERCPRPPESPTGRYAAYWTDSVKLELNEEEKHLIYPVAIVFAAGIKQDATDILILDNLLI